MKNLNNCNTLVPFLFCAITDGSIVVDTTSA